MMGDVTCKVSVLVDTCAIGKAVGRLAERRLIQDQPVEEVRRHGTGGSVNVRVRD